MVLFMVIWLATLALAIPNAVYPLITPAPKAIKREDGGGIIGYESLGPNSCKSCSYYPYTYGCAHQAYLLFLLGDLPSAANPTKVSSR
jgi:hypothetical protein